MSRRVTDKGIMAISLCEKRLQESWTGCIDALPSFLAGESHRGNWPFLISAEDFFLQNLWSLNRHQETFVPYISGVIE